MAEFAEPRFCVLILCYNEAPFIQGVIDSVRPYAPDILVVDDGSQDGSVERIQGSGVPALFHARNHGKGQAIRTGLGWILDQDFDYVVFMDGDGQHDAADLPSFVQAMREGYDFICGNRMHQPSGMPNRRRVTNLLGSWALSRIIHACVPDTMVGYRAISCCLLRRFPLISQGFTIETEILLRSFEHEIRHCNIPVKTIYHPSTENKYQGVRDSWRIFFFCGGMEANERRWLDQKPVALLDCSHGRAPAE
jgi:glycosyltransferase involved in cell wall biosynthesis